MQGAEVSSNLAFRAIKSGSAVSDLRPFTIEPASEPGRLRINVLFTNPNDTQIALMSAATLAAGLHAEIALIITQTVPYPLALDNPPVPVTFAYRQIRGMALSVSADLDGYVYYCRNPLETLLIALRPHSLVIIGLRKQWFFSKSERLARALRRSGHDVILANIIRGV